MSAHTTIENRAALLLKLRTHGIRNTDVLRAIETIPREMFVAHQFADLAQRDLPLPIACGQTMSEPSLVARMLEALDLRREHRVLEIGTGSGYVTAILASLAKHVVSVDRFNTLVAGARTRLGQLGIKDADVICADGFAAELVGPFDRVLIHLSLGELPAPVCDLLAPGGALVYGRATEQGTATRLIRAIRASAGEIEATDHGACLLPKPIADIAAAL
ncbi:MAG: methyltransferase domain-containing protein [Methylobacteriaceae bacterium]|nr:methyltransferase domain-containing protein [Methylobacteriaceae bacterium]